MKAEANPTKAVKFCKILPAFGQPGFLWVTELFSTFASVEPMWDVGCKSWKRENTKGKYKPGCL